MLTEQYEFFLVSSLEKVFPAQRPEPLPAGTQLSAWACTRAAVQLAYYAPPEASRLNQPQPFEIHVEGGPAPACMRKVELLPSDFPSYAYAREDKGYLTHEPGLFPDLLRPLEGGRVVPIPGQYRSLWLSWDIPADTEPGQYIISIKAKAVEQGITAKGTVFKNPEARNLCFSASFTLRISRAKLPEQSLIHTEWFHADCLSSYYQVAPWSEKHWLITERFIAEAAKHGVNMLLTPVFTPPLDTQVGGERPTVQLVGVSRINGTYSFDFTLLARWTSLCKKHGISYLEIAHLFTQWGARATPKIMAGVDGTYRRIFGWDVSASSPEYRAFLEAFLPSLRKELADEGFDCPHVYFHLSDEPGEEHLESYRAAKLQVEDLLRDCPVIDALSSFEYYHKGLVKHPIPASDHIQPFLDAHVPDLWVYYCCGQSIHVPNRFYAMPSARNRMMGVLMYLYDIKGFLHWGFNFYHTKYSIHPVDPYRMTHCDYAFPSGDPYLVYPGPDGMPLSSIRAEVQDDALLDLRALRLLESLTDRTFVEQLIYDGVKQQPMTFQNYPLEEAYLLNLREKTAAEIEKHL